MVTPNRYYTPNALATFLTAGNLQSLASGSGIIGAAYDNTVNLDLLADFELAIQYATGPPAVGTKVGDLYLISAIDGTNYASVGSGIPQKILLVGSFESRVGSTSALEYLTLPGVAIPPFKFEAVFVNQSGVSLHASALMFLKGQPYQLQSS